MTFDVEENKIRIIKKKDVAVLHTGPWIRVRVIVQHPETVGHGPQLFQTFTVHRYIEYMYRPLLYIEYTNIPLLYTGK